MPLEPFTGITSTESLSDWSANWSFANGTYIAAAGTVTGGEVAPSGTGGEQHMEYYSGAGTPAANHWAAAQITNALNSTASIFPAVRIQTGTANQCYTAYIDTTNGRILKVLALSGGEGTGYSFIGGGGGTFSYTSGRYYKIEAIGDATSTTINVYESTDGETWGSAVATAVETSSVYTGGEYGLHAASNDTTIVLDNWSAGDVVSATANILLQWKDNASGDSVDAGISMKYTTG